MLTIAHETDTLQAKMAAAFKLVDPTSRAGDWKAPIDTCGTRAAFEAACTALGVTFEDVLEAVRFYTATEPTVTEEQHGACVLVRIKADGYRRGPAGDH